MCWIVKRADFGHDNRKLVAANSRQNGIRTKQRGDPVGEFAERFVSHGVAVHVVDLLEAIEVEHEDSQWLRSAGTAEILIEFFSEKSPVRQAGQGVVPCQIARLQFGADTGFDFAGEVLIPAKSIDHPDYAEYETHKNNVVDLPLLISHPKFEYVMRNVIKIRTNVNAHSEAQKDNGVALISPQSFNRGEFKKGTAWSANMHDIRPIKC